LGEDITFLHAPVMVADIVLIDPDTEQEYILPGVLGMNYFAASFGDLAASGTAFQHLVFHEPGAFLGFGIRSSSSFPSQPRQRCCFVAGSGCCLDDDDATGAIDIYGTAGGVHFVGRSSHETGNPSRRDGNPFARG
jgi:hypothetical protein